ncbi:predicted protein [Coccidioides posadasii str. Silveira]|uniref:Predicted protein n=1 Tax=Coccidioides posadasii (strain RMSCC 757 / Silveira) TaxID=443226 RepID=E9CVT0_COCPS|nr:predicted protein [Coccidioides posadasii str. Silveira]
MPLDLFNVLPHSQEPMLVDKHRLAGFLGITRAVPGWHRIDWRRRLSDGPEAGRLHWYEREM